MISGPSHETDDYYGFKPIKTLSSNNMRRMKRTQLSNQKKQNKSLKSVQSQRDSSLSRAKSRTINRNTSILKNSESQALKNSHSRYHDQLPSSTQLQSVNLSVTKKSRLQISTGVIGIKMDNLSPTTVLSHPSKVLFVNEKTSGKKGSKSKKQKSILYLEYNNFMTEQSANTKAAKSPQTTSDSKKQALSPRINVKEGKKQKPQIDDNIQNEYFAGVTRKIFVNQKSNTVSSPKTQSQKMLSVKNISTKAKHQTSIANLSITSNRDLQSAKLISSPKVYKMEQDSMESKQMKTKISKHQIFALREKHNQQRHEKQKESVPLLKNKNTKLALSPEPVKLSTLMKAKSAEHGIQVNIAQNIIPKDKQLTLIKPKQLPKQQPSQSQKTIKYFETSKYQKQHKTSKDIIIKHLSQQNKKSPSTIPLTQQSSTANATSNEALQNPYSLSRNDNLVNQYNKKKQNQENAKNSSPVYQFNGLNNSKKNHDQDNFSQVSQSGISYESKKSGRILLRQSRDQKKSGSKISIASSSRSKLKMNINVNRKNDSEPKKFEAKTPQPYSTYKDFQISAQQKLKTSQNQSQMKNKLQQMYQKQLSSLCSENLSEEPQKIIKPIPDYTSAYYTPNPHKNLNNSQKHSNYNSKYDYDKSSIASQMQSQGSELSNFEINSQASSMQDEEDRLSARSYQKSNISSASKLKRQELAKKSHLRSSRNSLKSNQSHDSKKITLQRPSFRGSVRDSARKSIADSSLQSSVYKESNHPVQNIEESKKSIYDSGNLINSSKNNSQIPAINLQTKNKGAQKQIVQSSQAHVQPSNQSQPKPRIFLKVSKEPMIPKLLSPAQNNQNQNSIRKKSKEESFVQNSQDCKSLRNSSKESPNNLNISQSQNRKSRQKKDSKVEKASGLNMNSLISSSRQKQNSLKKDSKMRDTLMKNQNSDYHQDTSFDRESQMRVTQHKKQIAVQSIESQIEALSSEVISKKLTDTIRQNQQSNLHNIQSSMAKRQQLNQSSNKNDFTKSRKQGSRLEQSHHQMIKSVLKRRGEMKSSLINSQHSMTGSRRMKSNITVKSGRNLKPFSTQNPKIQEFIEYLEQYQIAIGFLYLYVQNTTTFYCSQGEQHRGDAKIRQFKTKLEKQKSQKYESKYQRLGFLMMKKYLYEKNRIIKCLRGLESNIFNLTGLEIPQKVFKKFVNHQKTKQKLRQFEQETKQLFKQLEELFRSLRLKNDNKKDPLIKLETPYDNFTRDIVQGLVEQLNQLTADIDDMEAQTSSKISSSNPSLPLKRNKNGPQSITSVIAEEIMSSQERAIETMELVFLLSELQSRKVKKLELLNIGDIDFQTYYETYIDKLLTVYEYFQAVKYPSDQPVKQKVS